MSASEAALSTVADDAAARRAWVHTIGRVDRYLSRAKAKRSQETLGQITLARADFRVAKDTAITISGPATFSLSMLLDGSFTSCLDGGAPLTVTSGSAVLFATRQPVTGTNHFAGGQRIRVVDMRFEPALLEEAGGVPLSRFAHELLIDRSMPGDGTTFMAFPAPKDLIRVGMQLFDCGIADEAARRLFLKAKSLEALALTIAALGSRRAQAPALTEAERAKLTRAREILRERYDEHWTIASLARAIGISERKLKLGFRATIGSSVHAYLKHVRLDAAAAMLREGRAVTDVALSVGFENLSHFSKVFREAHGVNPSDFARMRPSS